MSYRRGVRGPRALLRAWGITVIGLLVLPALASAHAVVVASSPAAGSRVASAPAVVEATFSEPLNRPLSHLTLQTAGGRPIRAGLVAVGPVKLMLEPRRRLGRGVYSVRWHSVSADDGHTVDGAYVFSVAAPVTAAGTGLTGVGDGGGAWFPLLLRCLFDGSVILFCGGIFCNALLSPARVPGGWLLPSPDERDAASLWRITLRLGVGAILFSVAVGLQDTARAGGGLSVDSVHRYLFADTAGVARLTVTVALLLSVLMAARRAPWFAGALAFTALVAVGVGGHASAARPRGVAITADVAHLAAASVWIGGMVHLVAAWVPRLRALSPAERRKTLELVLPRFGSLAIGAFAVLAVAGAVTAGTELPSVTALWADSYGRTLSVKLALVAAIASISYVHAVKLRPRLLASSAARSATERRHWRLLSTEPLLAAGVIVAAAWLAASGPPPSALASDPAARPGATDSLSVAGQAGPYIINAVVTRRPRDVDVELRTLDALERPIAIAARVAGTIRQRRCGVGCTRLTLWRPPTAVTVEVTDRGYAYRTSIPSRFVPGSTQLAQRLVSDVASSSRDLRSVAIAETLGDGRGGSEVTQYRVRSPNRFAYRLLRDGHTIAETIIVGGRQWTQKGGRGTWKVSPYGASGLQFSSRAYLNWWTQYATEPRLLGIVDARRQADVAAMTAVAGLGTVWLRLRIDLAHKRLLRVQMITVAHFMTQTWAEFNAPTPIHPPWHCSSLRG